MSAHATKNTIEGGEPIVIDLTLHLDSPYHNAVDEPREQMKQAQRLKHFLTAELWDENKRIASASIGGTRFVAEEGTTEPYARVIGWFGTEETATPHSRFTFWTAPGRFRVVVKGVDSGLEADAFFCQIIAPRTPAATEMLVEGELDALALLSMQPRLGDPAIKAFEQVAREFPDVVAGQYTRAALVIRKARQLRQGTAERSTLDVRDLKGDLQEVVEGFDAGHPYRNHGLFELAWLLTAQGQTESATDLAQRIVEESRDGDMRSVLPRVSSGNLFQGFTWG